MESKTYKSQKRRSFAKAVSWRAIALASDFTIIFFFIKKALPSLGIALTAVGIALASNTISTIIYYFHERVWNRVEWGKE